MFPQLRCSTWITTIALTAVSLHAGQIDLFFVGGQSNATSSFSSGIQQRLKEADRWDNPIVVHSNHPGNRISLWYDGGPQGNYETDFKNNAGTGILEAKIAELEAAGNTVTIAGFFWFQGEGDTGLDSNVTSYPSRFNGMLNQLAVDLNGGEAIPFAITRIFGNESDPFFDENPGRYQRVLDLSEVQRQIADDSVIGSWADSRTYPRGDAWHLSEADRVLFGAELAEAFLANLHENVGSKTTVNGTVIRAFGSTPESYTGGTFSGRLAYGWSNTHTNEQIWKTMIAVDLSDTTARDALLAHDTITLDIDNLPTVPSDGGPFRVVYAGQGDRIPNNGANFPVNGLWPASVAPQILGTLNGGVVGASYDVTDLLKGLDLSTNDFVYFRIESTNPGPNSSLSGTTSVFSIPPAESIQLVGCTPVLAKKILPLGDSITNGTRGSFVGSGYRYYLENLLIAYGYEPGIDYQMVGSKGNGYRTDPDVGDAENLKQWLNAGRGGWSIATTLAGGTLYGNVEPALVDLVQEQDPDIVMVMLGTNDIGFSNTNPVEESLLDSLREDYRDLLDTLLAQNPNIQVIMAKIPPVASTSGTPADVNSERIEPYNDEVVQVVFNEYASVYPGWKLIDNYSILDATTPTDDFDPSNDVVHPIDRGHERMARNWFKALVSLLENDVVSVTGVSEPGGQDALLRGGSDASVALNSGTDWGTRGIRLNADAATPEKALLRFDVASLPASAESAVLGLTWVGTTSSHAGNSGISSTIDVYGLDDGLDGWDESTVTWNTAPGNDASSASGADIGSATYLGSISIPADVTPGDTVALRSELLADFLSIERGVDELVSFLLTTSNSNYTSWLGELANANYHPAFLIVGEGRTRPGSLEGFALSENAIRLEWQDLTDGETGFTLHRRVLGSAEWLTVSSNIAANATNYLDTGLSSATYEYRLSANGISPLEWSNCSVVVAQRVDPATRVYEPFDYEEQIITDGSVIGTEGGVGFSGKWSNTGAPTEAAAFEVGSLEVASNPFVTVGGAVGFGALGNTASRSLLPRNYINLDTDGIVYFSFLFRPGSLNFNHLGFTGGSDVITVGNRNRSSDNTPLWRAIAGGGSQGTSVSPAINLSDAYFIAGRLITSESSNEQIQFTAYSATDAVPAGEPSSFLVNSVPEALTGVITGISLSGGDASNLTGVDEIRIGDTWEAVTSVPGYQSFNAWAIVAGVSGTTASADLNSNGVLDGIEYVIDGSSGAIMGQLPNGVFLVDGSSDYFGLSVSYDLAARDFALFVEESEDLTHWHRIWESSDSDALNHPLVEEVYSDGSTNSLMIRSSRSVEGWSDGKVFLRFGIQD